MPSRRRRGAGSDAARGGRATGTTLARCAVAAAAVAAAERALAAAADKAPAASHRHVKAAPDDAAAQAIFFPLSVNASELTTGIGSEASEEHANLAANITLSAPLVTAEIDAPAATSPLDSPGDFELVTRAPQASQPSAAFHPASSTVEEMAARRTIVVFQSDIVSDEDLGSLCTGRLPDAWEDRVLEEPPAEGVSRQCSEALPEIVRRKPERVACDEAACCRRTFDPLLLLGVTIEGPAPAVDAWLFCSGEYVLFTEPDAVVLGPSLGRPPMSDPSGGADGGANVSSGSGPDSTDANDGPTAATTEEPEAEPAPEPELEPEPEPEPEPESTLMFSPPSPSFAPTPTPAGSPMLVPEPEPEPVSVPEPEPEPVSIPEPEPIPAAVPEPPPVPVPEAPPAPLTEPPPEPGHAVEQKAEEEPEIQDKDAATDDAGAPDENALGEDTHLGRRALLTHTHDSPSLEAQAADAVDNLLASPTCQDPSTTSWALDRMDQRRRPDLQAPARYRGLGCESESAAPSGGGGGPELQNATGLGVFIYVIDTGVDALHAEFRTQDDRTRAVKGYDYVDDIASVVDYDGHGTAVAALAAGSTTGTAPRATIVPLRALSRGTGLSSHLILALQMVATEHHFRPENPSLVVMSFTTPASNSLALAKAIERVVALGVTIVAAAGQTIFGPGSDACDVTPGGLDSVITVSGSTPGDEFMNHANMGPCVDLFAPAVDVRTACTRNSACEEVPPDVPGLSSAGSSGVDLSSQVFRTGHSIPSGASANMTTGYASVTGTSFATPLVAGVVARVLSRYPFAQPAEIKAFLKLHATRGAIRSAPPQMGAGDRNVTTNLLVHTLLESEKLAAIPSLMSQWRCLTHPECHATLYGEDEAADATGDDSQGAAQGQGGESEAAAGLDASAMTPMKDERPEMDLIGTAWSEEISPSALPTFASTPLGTRVAVEGGLVRDGKVQGVYELVDGQEEGAGFRLFRSNRADQRRYRLYLYAAFVASMPACSPESLQVCLVIDHDTDPTNGVIAVNPDAIPSPTSKSKADGSRMALSDGDSLGAIAAAAASIDVGDSRAVCPLSWYSLSTSKDVVVPGAPPRWVQDPIFITHANAPCDTALTVRALGNDGNASTGTAEVDALHGVALNSLYYPGAAQQHGGGAESHDGVMTGEGNASETTAGGQLAFTASSELSAFRESAAAPNDNRATYVMRYVSGSDAGSGIGEVGEECQAAGGCLTILAAAESEEGEPAGHHKLGTAVPSVTLLAYLPAAEGSDGARNALRAASASVFGAEWKVLTGSPRQGRPQSIAHAGQNGTGLDGSAAGHGEEVEDSHDAGPHYSPRRLETKCWPDRRTPCTALRVEGSGVFGGRFNGLYVLHGFFSGGGDGGGGGLMANGSLPKGNKTETSSASTMLVVRSTPDMLPDDCATNDCVHRHGPVFKAINQTTGDPRAYLYASGRWFGRWVIDEDADESNGVWGVGYGTTPNSTIADRRYAFSAALGAVFARDSAKPTTWAMRTQEREHAGEPWELEQLEVRCEG